jgi:hypothetical protein
MEALRKVKIDQHVIIRGLIQFDAKGRMSASRRRRWQNLKRTPTVVMPWPRRQRLRFPRAGLERQAADLISDFSRARPGCRQGC